jgi:hypothetical protein
LRLNPFANDAGNQLAPHQSRPFAYSQLIPASGSTRCRIAATQINTTSDLRSFRSRPSLRNLSIA